MPSPNQNSAEMKAWLAQANAATLGDSSCEFGNFGDDRDADEATETPAGTES